ncbi:6-pyruvoyl trahydropterin synthase family protein [Gaopeijia maritima]|uniref:6-carboxy-5,6,7,8-tetrahydropterin synthase n=1 Tax=Gaopeijia maritima TaxID=3119007 RepID=A0ABU9E9Y5_9BACT
MNPADPTSAPPSPTLTRRIRFRASHAYGRDEWDSARNRATFGDQLRPHEHDWVVEATVAGALDPDTGWVVDLAELDGALEEIRGRLAGRDVREAVPERFGPGARQPSTEELARWVWSTLADRLQGEVSLARVRVAESDDLWAECVAQTGGTR